MTYSWNPTDPFADPDDGSKVTVPSDHARQPIGGEYHVIRKTKRCSVCGRNIGVSGKSRRVYCICKKGRTS